MMEARCRSRDCAGGALLTRRRISGGRSLIVIVAALPGMVSALLVNGNLAKLRSLNMTVSLLVSQLRIVGLVVGRAVVSLLVAVEDLPGIDPAIDLGLRGGR